MPIIPRCLTQIGALVSLALALALPAQAVTYSKASLNGTYNFLFAVQTPDPDIVQYVSVGVMSFNGKGGIRGSYTTLQLQELQSGTLTGNYTVAHNGMGTITFTEGIQAKFGTVLSSNAAGLVGSIQMLQINVNSIQPNQNIAGTAQLLSTGAQTFSVASLSGVFSFQYQLFTVQSEVLQTGSIGLASFDGNGNCKLTSETVTDGKYSTSTEGCTYTVASNGMGTISNGAVFALGGASTGQASGFQFFVTGTELPQDYVVFGGANLQ